MIKSKKPHLILFFSYGVSLHTWAETGLIGRELLLYKKMIQRGYKITFVTYGDTSDYKYSNHLDGINIIPVFSIIKKSKNRWINLFKSFVIPFNHEIKKRISDADIYKTNQMVASWVAIISSIINNKPLVVRCGYEMLRNLLRDEKNPVIWVIKAIFAYSLEFIAYSYADMLILSNKSDIKFIKRLFPVTNKKLTLIRNFIDTDHFCNNNAKHVETKKKTALFIGRLEQCKNIENLICGSVSADCALDIIGNGEKKRDLKKIAEKQNGNINFLGRIDNRKLPDIIRQYDLFVLSSFYEGNPKSLLEAMACARVVLGTNVNGIRELIDQGVTGFLCNTDSESIKKKILTIFNTPDDKLNTIAKNARQFVVAECSIEKVLSQEMSIYKELLS